MTDSPGSAALVTQIVWCDGTALGPRMVDSYASILQVRAAPYSQRASLISADLHFIAYVVDSPKVYTGHGRATRTIGDKLPPNALDERTQTYVICSLDPRLDKEAAAYVEARLIKIAHDCGVPLANGKHPYGHDGLRLCPNREQLVVHAQLLLMAAGFRRFEKARRADPHRRLHVDASSDLHDVRVTMPNELAIPVGAQRKRLFHKTLRAEGYRHGNRFVVLPGADYSVPTKGSVSADNRRRREAIGKLDIFEELPGLTDRRRLLVGLDCRSAPIAATLITGEHCKNSAWERVPESVDRAEAAATAKPSAQPAGPVKPAPIGTDCACASRSSREQKP